jgi:hypothetical protein
MITELLLISKPIDGQSSYGDSKLAGTDPVRVWEEPIQVMTSNTGVKDATCEVLRHLLWTLKAIVKGRLYACVLFIGVFS